MGHRLHYHTSTCSCSKFRQPPFRPPSAPTFIPIRPLNTLAPNQGVRISERRESTSEINEEAFTIELPTELLVEILCRAPIKSLLRFKSVCKYWYSLFESPMFIKKHQTLVKPDPCSFAMLQGLFPSSKEGVWHVLWSIIKPESNVTIKFPFLYQHVNVLGVSNGLLACLIEKSGDIYICNPTTGRFRIIPSPGLTCSSESKLPMYGFHSHLNDYSLYRFFCTRLPSGKIGTVKAEVFRMGNDNWSEVLVGEVVTSERSPTTMVRLWWLPPRNVTINGVFYWKSYYADAVVEFFDMSKNLYGEITCPVEPRRCWEITNLKGKFALMCSDTMAVKGFDLYVLDGDNWTPKHTMNMGRNIMGLSFVGSLGNGTIILKDTLPDFLQSYDPASDEIKCLPFPGSDVAEKSYLYVESLVAV